MPGTNPVKKTNPFGTIKQIQLSPSELDVAAVAAEQVAHLELAGDPGLRQHQLEVRQLQLVHEVRRMALARGE